MTQEQWMKLMGPILVAVGSDLMGWLTARSNALKANQPMPVFDYNLFTSRLILGGLTGLGLNVQVG